MDPTAAIIAVTGLLTTFSSPLILSKLNARNQRKASLRDLQTVLYTEATVYAQALESMLDRITEAYSTYKKGPELTHTDALTARMRLLAPDEVIVAWKELLANEERLRWNMEQDNPGFGHYPGDALALDHVDVVDLRQAIEKFYAATRKASVGGSSVTPR